jgi:hypothetical protein
MYKLFGIFLGTGTLNHTHVQFDWVLWVGTL